MVEWKVQSKEQLGVTSILVLGRREVLLRRAEGRGFYNQSVPYRRSDTVPPPTVHLPGDTVFRRP